MSVSLVIDMNLSVECHWEPSTIGNLPWAKPGSSALPGSKAGKFVSRFRGESAFLSCRFAYNHISWDFTCIWAFAERVDHESALQRATDLRKM